MSTDKIVGLSHHTMRDENDPNRLRNFREIHCNVTIVGNWKGQRLDQWWWNVTPDHVFMPKQGNGGVRKVHWHLHLMGMGVGNGRQPWDKDCGWSTSPKGIVFPSSSGIVAELQDDGTYMAQIPKAIDPDPNDPTQTVSIKYDINFTVGGVSHACDPELEIGMDD